MRSLLVPDTRFPDDSRDPGLDLSPYRLDSPSVRFLFSLLSLFLSLSLSLGGSWLRGLDLAVVSSDLSALLLYRSLFLSSSSDEEGDLERDLVILFGLQVDLDPVRPLSLSRVPRDDLLSPVLSLDLDLERFLVVEVADLLLALSSGDLDLDRGLLRRSSASISAPFCRLVGDLQSSLGPRVSRLSCLLSLRPSSDPRSDTVRCLGCSPPSSDTDVSMVCLMSVVVHSDTPDRFMSGQWMLGCSATWDRALGDRLPLGACWLDGVGSRGP